MDTSKTPNSTRIPNLASKIGATSHEFRDIDVFRAFALASALAGLLGATMGKALKTSISRNI